MATFTNKTKNSTTWSNNQRKDFIAGEGFDSAAFDISAFDVTNAEYSTSFTNKSKNSTSWTNETKN